MKKIMVFIALFLAFVGMMGGTGTLLWFGEKVDGTGYVMAAGVVTLGCMAFPKVKELRNLLKK